MTAKPSKATPAAATAPSPIPTGLVGADGYEAWVHLAMWCPQSLRQLEESTENVPMHFWRLNRKIARMQQTVTANLRRSHPNRSHQQTADQAAALVRAEWVTIPKEVSEAVWVPEPAMDTTSTQWRWWQWPGLEDGQLWARKLLEAATDPDLTREELTAALGPPPLPERLTEPLAATTAAHITRFMNSMPSGVPDAHLLQEACRPAGDTEAGWPTVWWRDVRALPTSLSCIQSAGFHRVEGIQIGCPR